MCLTCYLDAGAPAVLSDKVERALAMALVVDTCGHYALHIQLDDYNLEDEHFDAESEEYVREHGTPEEIECFKFFRGLTEAERLTAVALRDGYLTILEQDGQKVLERTYRAQELRRRQITDLYEEEG